MKEDSNDEFEVVLGRGIEIELTWKVGFVMVVIPGMNFIQKPTSVDPSQGDYETVLGRWQELLFLVLING